MARATGATQDAVPPSQNLRPSSPALCENSLPHASGLVLLIVLVLVLVIVIVFVLVLVIVIVIVIVLVIVIEFCLHAAYGKDAITITITSTSTIPSTSPEACGRELPHKAVVPRSSGGGERVDSWEGIPYA